MGGKIGGIARHGLDLTAHQLYMFFWRRNAKPFEERQVQLRYENMNPLYIQQVKDMIETGAESKTVMSELKAGQTLVERCRKELQAAGSKGISKKGGQPRISSVLCTGSHGDVKNSGGFKKGN